MSNPRLYTEAEEKQRAYEAQCMREQTIGGACGELGSNKPDPDRLIDRIRRRAEDCRQQAQRGEDLGELEYLLEKNPEVARILDLVAKTGVI